MIERLGLSDRIRIIKGNHLMLPIEAPADLIMVAAQAEPKDTIFNHLATIMPAGTKISYRIYEKELNRLLDTFSRYELPENLNEYLKIRPTHPANNTSVVLSVGCAYGYVFGYLRNSYEYPVQTTGRFAGVDRSDHSTHSPANPCDRGLFFSNGSSCT